MTNKCSFDIIRLKLFIDEHKLSLIGDYNYVTRNSLITGICKTPNCSNQFTKNFRTLIRNNSYHCEVCMTYIKINKRKETHIKNCGFSTNLKCPITKEKIRQTTLKKFGVEHNSQCQSIKEQKKQTTLKNFGVEYPTQSELIKQKGRETSKINYGVEHPSQNADYAEKNSKQNYSKKEYVMPSGKTVNVQGYEPFALDCLMQNEQIKEEEIVLGCKNVPTIWYNDEFGKKHRHYVDIFIPNLNKCIEVKSTWTKEKKKDCIFLKQKAAKDLGYKYELWIYDKKGNRLEVYS
jgi:hypothetical protein